MNRMRSALSGPNLWGGKSRKTSPIPSWVSRSVVDGAGA